jgi:hypothetical protein
LGADAAAGGLSPRPPAATTRAMFEYRYECQYDGHDGQGHRRASYR